MPAGPQYINGKVPLGKQGCCVPTSCSSGSLRSRFWLVCLAPGTLSPVLALEARQFGHGA